MCVEGWEWARPNPSPPNIASMKNGFPKSPSRIYNRWCEIFFAECERVVAENWKDVCFSQKWVRMFHFYIFRRRHISKHLSENISLSFPITAHVHVRPRIKYIRFSLYLFNFRKTVWRCQICGYWNWKLNQFRLRLCCMYGGISA